MMIASPKSTDVFIDNPQMHWLERPLPSFLGDNVPVGDGIKIVVYLIFWVLLCVMMVVSMYLIEGAGETGFFGTVSSWMTTCLTP